MSRFRPAGFRKGQTAWRRASRPDSGRPARRRSTAFRDRWTAWRRRASRNPAASRNAVSPWEGAPRSAASRWEAAANPRLGAIAWCSRYWKFESISLQQTVCLSPAVFFEGREPGFPRGSGAAGWTTRSAETRRYFDMAPNPSNISVGPYSSTAVSLIWAARMPERNQAFSRLNRAVDL
jgi:hypothetical protein